MILRQLKATDREAFEKLLDEWDDSPGFNMLYGLIEVVAFSSYLKVLEAMRDDLSCLYAFVGDEIVGKANVRHHLNKHLENLGGHIGYGVLNHQRKKGYATEILKQALDYCRELGLDRVLITCDENNIGSCKVIERNGGVLENLFDPKDGSSLKKRYWINL